MGQVQNKKPDAKKDDKHNQETEGLKKIDTYLRTIPTVTKKFKGRPQKKRSPTSAELLLDPKYSASKEGPFGLGPLVFPCLQRFNNIDCFMIFFIASVLIHGALFALADMILNLYHSLLTLSKRELYFMDFSGYIVSSLVAIFVAHFGGKGNRTKWIAAACILMAFGSILLGFPFSKYEIMKSGGQRVELCVEENKRRNIHCVTNSNPDRTKCICFFIIGQCLNGIAGMPIYILGKTFIFDHVPTRSAGFYLALGHSAHLMGYFLGIFGGMKNLSPPPKEKLSAVDSAKIHLLLQFGWWKTFLFVAAISFSVFLVLLCFPTSLPGAHKLKLAKRKEPPTFDKRLKDQKIQPRFKGFVFAIWYMLRNPLLMTQAMCKVSESFAFHTSLEFLPYHLQTQFSITPQIASMLTGLFVIPGGVIGHFLGGLIVDRLEMTNKNKLKFSLVTSVVSVALFLLIFFVECETTKFAGINEDYDGLGKLGNLTAGCNYHCACTTSLYSSVCGRDEKEYFSPCFAGCSATKVQQNEKTYYNCSCIKEGLTTSDADGHFIDATDGTCNSNCLTLPLFFAFYFSATVFSTMCSTPIILIILQSVPANFSSLGLGVTVAITKFTASVPEPALFGTASSVACKFWDINACGVREKCWIYNKTTLVYVFIGIWVSFKLFTALLNIYAIHIYDYVVKGKISDSKTTHVKASKAQKERRA
ncbi:solute carrier organic anion transporter family, member 6c1 [Rattus norvegicus]|uniref:Solute carrier organic anion transporter family, member 6c1 n=2 Tax=Rattus norvegicus TaxID=10116 RepID=G3V7R7_RAT|nr:solute carrier organic anion transporter family, member 6c1 [Rattus norvegicus]